MTVRLNEAALQILLETEEGPVGRYVQRRADEVVALAQANVRDYFGGAPSVTVDQDVGSDMLGSTAIIGIRDPGLSRSPERSKARRLATYQAEGRVNWLRRALEVVF